MMMGPIVKRLLIFGLLGPALGSLMVFGVLLPGFGYAVGDAVKPLGEIGQAVIVLMPLAYAFGLIPALVAGGIDAVLAARAMSLRARLIWAGCAGYVLGFFPLLPGSGSMHFHPVLLLTGLSGAVPALICCWLAAERKTAA